MRPTEISYSKVFFLLSDKRLDKLHSVIHHVLYANAIHPIKIIPVHQKGLEENEKKANTRFARYLALFQNPFIRTVLNAVAIPMLPSRLKLTHHHVTAAQFENCFIFFLLIVPLQLACSIVFRPGCCVFVMHASMFPSCFFL